MLSSASGYTPSPHSFPTRRLPIWIIPGRRPCSKSTSAPMSKPTVRSPESIPFSVLDRQPIRRKRKCFRHSPPTWKHCRTRLPIPRRSEEHTSELQSLTNIVCYLQPQATPRHLTLSLHDVFRSG